jgi:hypothetical protein
MVRPNALFSPNSRRQPGHHGIVGILTANCIRLNDSRHKGGGLLLSLPFVTRKRHPFADNFTSQVVLGSHRDFLSHSRRSKAGPLAAAERWLFTQIEIFIMAYEIEMDHLTFM